MKRIIIDFLSEVQYFFLINSIYLSRLLIWTIPYLMLLIGNYVYSIRGYIAPGGELFVPIIFMVLSSILKKIADYNGKGDIVPLPNKRFTSVDSDGEVSVDYDRMQEMLLYVADVEDFLARKNMI